MPFNYDLDYDTIDFRRNPELYDSGVGEQGVLLVEPYKTEILPRWRFRTPEVARESSDTIYGLFTQYRDAGDFVGMDMARKFLQMGWTRARRYANHRTGRKWSDGRTAELPDQVDETKAECAQIFYARYLEAREDSVYVAARKAHRAARKAASTPRTERF
jgi:Domain of unknown function (DUF4385)